MRWIRKSRILGPILFSFCFWMIESHRSALRWHRAITIFLFLELLKRSEFLAGVIIDGVLRQDGLHNPSLLIKSDLNLILFCWLSILATLAHFDSIIYFLSFFDHFLIKLLKIIEWNWWINKIRRTHKQRSNLNWPLTWIWEPTASQKQSTT